MLYGEPLAQGRSRVFVLVTDGRSEASEWLNALPEKAFRRLMAIARRLAADGFIANEQKFRRLADNVYEMKLRNPPYRLFCFRCGSDWYITHGCMKPGRRELNTRHIAKVRKLRQRFVEEGS